MSGVAWDRAYDHVTVTHDPAVTSAGVVRRTITETGFPATPAPKQ